MTKYRPPKNQQTPKLSELDYYQRILWFVIDDCCDSLTQQQKFDTLRRVSNEIFDGSFRAKKGRPKILDEARLSMLRSYLERHPEASVHNAAQSVATTNPDPTIAHESLVRRLLAQHGVDGKNYGKRTKKTKVSNLAPTEELVLDGLNQSKVFDAVIADFLAALERLLRLV